MRHTLSQSLLPVAATGADTGREEQEEEGDKRDHLNQDNLMERCVSVCKVTENLLQCFSQQHGC